MTDLEQVIHDFAKDFNRKGGVFILASPGVINIGSYGLSNDETIEALTETLEYIRDRVRGKPAGHTIIRR